MPDLIESADGLLPLFVRALGTLAEDENNHEYLASDGCVRTIWLGARLCDRSCGSCLWSVSKLAREGDPQQQESAARVLGDLAETASLHTTIAARGGMESLVLLSESEEAGA